MAHPVTRPFRLVQGDSGSLVVCLHGIGSCSAAFESQLRGLSGAHTVVAWDAPGYGRSPDPAGPLDLAGYVAEAARLIEDHGPHAHVVGVSWGGVIAQALAATSPELVDGLVLVGSSPGSGVSDATATAMRGRILQLAEQGPATYAELQAHRLVSATAPPALVEAVTTTMAGAIRLPGYGYAAEAMASADLRPQLGRIRARTLLAHGDQDDVTGERASLALLDGLPGAHLVALPGGHLVNQEAPEATNALLAAFFQAVDDDVPFGGTREVADDERDHVERR